MRPQGRFLKLLTANTRSIKMWKAFERRDKKVVKAATRELSLPKLQPTDCTFTANEQFIFPAVHTSEVNSISQSHNEEYLLSTDKERNLLWSLEKPNKPYIAGSLYDKKKGAGSEVEITCSKIHPSSDCIFAYGMNRCELGLCDIRTSCTSQII
jgi:WD40 repeat protein